MTPKELVFRSLEFDKPDRIPRQMWLLPWATIHHREEVERIQKRFPDDIVGCPYFCPPVSSSGDPYALGVYVDEWGCRFVNTHVGIIGQVKEPLIQQWEDVDQIREPVEALAVDAEEVAAFCDDTDRFVMAPCCPRPFERLQFLRGTENVMIDLAMGADELRGLLDRIHQFYVKEVELWATMPVDGIMFMDDWGSQESLLISPAMWREYFQPLYRQYVEIAHAAGKKVFMHSDGQIIDIIPELIELGVDALNSQVFCIGLEKLGDRFKGQITFWGEIDRQHLLPHASPDEIRSAAHQFVRCLYDQGGVIGQLEFGPGAKPDNIDAAFDTWESCKAR